MLSGIVDSQKLKTTVHDRVKILTVFEGIVFTSAEVKEELMTRVLRLSELSEVCIYDTDTIGPFWRLIYHRRRYDKLQALFLREFTADSQASRLFAKYSSWCNVDTLELERPRGRTSKADVCFIWILLTSCLSVKCLRFSDFMGCGIEPFALESRRRKREDFLRNDNRSRELIITTSAKRASLKNLLSKAMQLSKLESVAFTNSCVGKVREAFELSEWRYWAHIIDTRL